MGQLRISNSVRLILAMFRIYADIETDFGKGIILILKEQYPDQDVDADPAQVGHKLMNIARKELQQNDQDAFDTIQNFLTYISTGSKYELDEEGKFMTDEEGDRKLRSTPKPFDFTKGSPTWKDALLNIYNNVARKGITRSKKKMRQIREEKSIDEAFGRRTDEGGAEGGEGRMPTPDETSLGKTLDDASALKEFYTLIDQHIPQLKASLPDDERALFELVFDDEIGGFGGDIKENMGQATQFRENYPEVWEKFVSGPGSSGADDEKKLRLKWSAYVGKLRKNLLSGIWDYINDSMKMKDFKKLQDEFFSDYDPSAQERQVEEKEKEKASYQGMRDENNIARLKAKIEKDGKLSDADQKKFDRIKEKIEKAQLDAVNMELYDALKDEDDLTDVEQGQLRDLEKQIEEAKSYFDKIEANAAAGAKGKRQQKNTESDSESDSESDEEASSATASVVATAFHLAGLTHRPLWASPGA